MQMSQHNVSWKRGLAMTLVAWVALTGCEGSVAETQAPPEETVPQSSGPERHMLEGEDLCDSGDLSASEIARVEAEFQRLRVVRAARVSGSITVPVYFHVVRQGLALTDGEVSQKQVTDQMAVLNSAFANTPYRFNLVATDRTTNANWFRLLKGGNSEFLMKNQLRKGVQGTLNIFTVAPQDGNLGWSVYPWEISTRPVMDGVVISYASLPGGEQAPFNQGDTLVHMVGHWFGLLHTYEAGCTGGDGVLDTPAQASPAFGCPAARDSCLNGGTDPIHNFMDATDDSCKTQFTPGQAARVDSIGAAYRL